jgi:hypothetical protein
LVELRVHQDLSEIARIVEIERRDKGFKREILEVWSTKVVWKRMNFIISCEEKKRKCSNRQLQQKETYLHLRVNHERPSAAF